MFDYNWTIFAENKNRDRQKKIERSIIASHMCSYDRNGSRQMWKDTKRRENMCAFEIFVSRRFQFKSIHNRFSKVIEKTFPMDSRKIFLKFEFCV